MGEKGRTRQVRKERGKTVSAHSLAPHESRATHRHNERLERGHAEALEDARPLERVDVLGNGGPDRREEEAEPAEEVDGPPADLGGDGRDEDHDAAECENERAVCDGGELDCEGSGLRGRTRLLLPPR